MADDRVLRPPTPREIRAELERLVVADLYGPAGGDPEEGVPTRERVTDRYILGRLAPNGTVIDPDGQDALAESGVGDSMSIADADSGDTEPDAPSVPSLSCSAHGFTVCVEPETTELLAQASWARYLNERGHDGEPGVRRRHPRSFQALITLPEHDASIGPVDLDPDTPGITLRGRVRTYAGRRMVTLFLSNGLKGDERTQHLWLFQAELSLTAADGVSPVFVPRPESFSGGDRIDREENQNLAMTHRFHAEFAVGHSTAVDVRTAPGDRMRAVRVATATVPGYELPHTDVPNVEDDEDLPELADLVLDMAVLGAEGPDAVDPRAALDPLVTGYRAWIHRQKQRIDAPESRLSGDGVDYRKHAAKNLKEAGHAADRIEAALVLLETEADALAAFRFANRAMHAQRVRSIAAGKDQSTPVEKRVAESDQPGNRSWRPFQLAFLLLNLPAMTDPAHSERTGDGDRTADLLWFPTGGGKTEAYLGLTAYTLGIRRLQRHGAGPRTDTGVAVLMRYTLRLLTIQQFQRAAALICACEDIRGKDVQRWGDVPFRLGLWVGGRVTPNRFEQAQEWVKDKRSTKGGPKGADGTPHQLTSCPWCGSDLDAGRDIEPDAVARRTRVLCPDFSCRFSAFGSQGEGIPVLVVDEEIYRLVPSLVIATVDKFAQLAWQGEARSLFGGVERRCERHGFLSGDLDTRVCGGAKHHRPESKGPGYPAAQVGPTSALRPPDLIVQDELHLISGPLGSLVGLYETAVDLLSTWEHVDPATGANHRVRPKVIASTATIRRARQQMAMLFARNQTRIFPPQGLDTEDTFFSRRRDTDQRDGRRYVGICAHGVRVKSAQIRVYVAVMAAAQHLHDKYGGNEITDPYMTLVGYFNSLRDLGGMRRLVDDDVATRLGRADERGLANRRKPWIAELTSRLSSDDIPDILDRLDVGFSSTPPKDGPQPLDVLLATNMIAVGVDVPRLGAMVVSGQPKSTAEYVQATSRVGRRHPGIVFTVYNWARPRDLSHYERFMNFHATMYRHVEALSVTPFAARAIDRGLMGLVVALARNIEGALNPNKGAGRFDRNGLTADHVLGEIKRRAKMVDSDNSTVQRVADQTEHKLDIWHDRRSRQTADAVVLTYRRPPKPKNEVPLLTRPDDGRWTPTTCPNSLREVEPGIRLILDPGDTLGDAAQHPFVPRPDDDEEQV